MGKLPDETDPEPDEHAASDPALAACYGASVTNRVATGERAGRRVERIGDRVDVEDLQEAASNRCASVQGFSLHANVTVPARDRKRLERLCRYVARPPIATERLEELPDGRIAYKFRKPWRDGTRAVAFTPHELIEKLVALVPPPQTNMVRYHGVLAPASKLRKRVVRDRRRKETPVASTVPAASSKKAEREVPVGVAGRIGLEEELRPRRMSWAELMKRVFALDVLECPECKGRMKVIATITEPEAVRKFLGSIGVPTELPAMERARPDAPTTTPWSRASSPRSRRSSSTERPAAHVELLTRTSVPTSTCSTTAGVATRRSAISAPSISRHDINTNPKLPWQHNFGVHYFRAIPPLSRVLQARAVRGLRHRLATERPLSASPACGDFVVAPPDGCFQPGARPGSSARVLRT